MQVRVPKVVVVALVLVSSACTSFGGGSDESGGDASYAEMASHLRGGLGSHVWVMNVAALEEAGVVDRDDEGEIIPGIYDVVLDDYLGHSGLPGPWRTVHAHAFEWPDTRSVFGVVPEDADVIVTDTVSTVLRLSDAIDAVESTLADSDAWNGPDSTDDGTWEWVGDPDLAASDDPADASLDGVLTSGEYQATIEGDLLALNSLQDDADPLTEPFLEALEFVADAHLAFVVDGCGGVQAQIAGDPEEPPGGFLPTILVAAFTVTWHDDQPSEEMHLLFAADDDAEDAVTSLETTISEDTTVTSVFGTDATVSADGPMVTVTAGSDAMTDLAFQVRESSQRGGPIASAFAAEDQCEPLDG